MRGPTLVGWLATWSACTFSPPPDQSPDGPIDAACTSFSSQLDTCALPPGIPLDLRGALRFDTDSGILTDTAAAVTIPVVSVLIATRGGEVRALVATTVILRADARLRAEGTRGFAIIASSDLAIQTRAAIDVSKGGAGARGVAICPGGGQQGEDDSDGAAGGGGGGFGAAGGTGGNGDADDGQSTGGRAGPATDPAPLGPLGGCAGGAGGRKNTQNLGGPGGAGGGAIYLVSAVGIAIGDGGGLHAGGGGGGGGGFVNQTGDAGGGGGGSGGSIFLEAPRISSLGILSANGGGGGEASGGGEAGMPGFDAPFGVLVASGGSAGSPTGIDGGDGGHAAMPAGESVTDIANGGGGGGGGGVGVIRITSPAASLGTLVSPPPVP